MAWGFFKSSIHGLHRNGGCNLKPPFVHTGKLTWNLCLKRKKIFLTNLCFDDLQSFFFCVFLFPHQRISKESTIWINRGSPRSTPSWQEKGMLSNTAPWDQNFRRNLGARELLSLVECVNHNATVFRLGWGGFPRLVIWKPLSKGRVFTAAIFFLDGVFQPSSIDISGKETVHPQVYRDFGVLRFHNVLTYSSI